MTEPGSNVIPSEVAVSRTVLTCEGVMNLKQRFNKERTACCAISGVVPEGPKCTIGDVGGITLWIECTSFSYNCVVNVSAVTDCEELSSNSTRRNKALGLRQSFPNPVITGICVIPEFVETLI